MSVARPFRAAIQEPLSGGWDRNKYPGTMLIGRTLGIIGCGRIGTWVGRYGAAFGMRVIGYDPLTDVPPAITQVSLETLLAESDMVSVHVSYSEASRHLLNRDRIFSMKPGAVLVNTSRGELIDETALLDALSSGHLGGAGLDVLQGEPDVADHPLVLYARDHSNVVITPHIGGFSPDALRLVLDFSCDRIRRFFPTAQ
jgi:D-3-phosphoglycerate dehydrogenase